MTKYEEVAKKAKSLGYKPTSRSVDNYGFELIELTSRDGKVMAMTVNEAYKNLGCVEEHKGFLVDFNKNLGDNIHLMGDATASALALQSAIQKQIDGAQA